MQIQMQAYRMPLLPTYHEIVAGKAKYVYSTGSKALGEQLAVLGRLRVAGLAEPLQVTFDDAHRSQYELGLPALEQNRVKAVFFAIVQRAQSSPDYMRWGQLRELIRLGHEVQSHGVSHVPLTICRDSELRRELELSKSVLEDKLGVPVPAISIPFGRWDGRVLEACRRAGYTRVYTSDPCPRAVQNGVELIGRFMVRNITTAEGFQRSLLPSKARLTLMRAQHVAKCAIRRLIGDRNYHLLWCYLSGRNGDMIEGEYAGNEDTAINQ